MKEFYWLNKDSRKFLERGYLLEGVTAEERLKQIADEAEQRSGQRGFSEKFYTYLSKGWISLSTPIWCNYGLERGLPISCFSTTFQDDTADILRGSAEIGMLSKYGGGTAGYFGNLRPRGEDISGGGKTNGSVAFMEIFDTLMNIISQGCYDENTEILTEKGWMFFEDVIHDKKLKVAQVNDNDEIEFVVPTDYIKYPVKENLLNFKDSKNIDLLVTKNHNMVFKYDKKFTKTNEKGDIEYNRIVKPEYRTKIAEEIPLHRDVKFAHGSFLPKGNGISNYERLLIAMQADGSLCTHYKKGNRFRFTKKRKKERFENLLKALEIDYNYSYYEKDKTHNFYFNIGEELPKQFNEWVDIKDKSKEWAEEFLKEVSEWDGKKITEDISFSYSSIHKENVDILQSIAAVCGYKSSMTVDERIKYPNKSTIYNIVLSKGQYFGVEKMEPKEVYYEGNVYCVEVPSHKLIVRRNGKTVVCGNSSRRGSFAAYLPIDHKDIEEFLTIRNDESPIQNLSLGVTIPEGWMDSMIEGDKQKRRTWAKVLQKRSETGFPYLYFTDNVNNNKPQVYKDKEMKLVVSNLCSEIMEYVDDEKTFTCCLSSVNLLHYDEWKDTDLIQTMTLFLDTVLDEFIEKATPIPFLEKAVKFAREHRSIGLGVLGLHSYLQSKMMPFEGLETKMLLNQIFSNINKKSLEESKRLTAEKGEPLMLKNYGERFTTRLAIAPTTSSSFILGQVSPSIEPLNSNYFLKDVAKGKFTYRNPYLKKLLKEKDKDTNEVWTSILSKGGSVQHLKFLTEEEKNVFKTFGEISQMEVVQNAAIIQKYIDQGISLNLMIHPDVPVKDINKLIIQAWKLGIKTLYYQRSANSAQELSRSILECSSCEA